MVALEATYSSSVHSSDLKRQDQLLVQCTYNLIVIYPRYYMDK